MDLNLSSHHSNKLVFFEKIGSTNEFLLQNAEVDAIEWPDLSVVCAGQQTSGRGRNQREWKSPEGSSLSCSILVRNPKGAAHWYGILLAMALTRSLKDQGVQAGLKWPNDVLVAENKIAGVLGQASADFLVVGIGLNLRPIEIENSVSLEELNLDLDFDFQLSRLLAEFVSLRSQFEVSSVAAVLEELREISHTLGRKVRVTTEAGILEGRATDIDSQGRLVLDRGAQTVSAGDILHLRGAEEI